MSLKINPTAIIFASILSATVAPQAADMTKLTDRMEKHTVSLIERKNTGDSSDGEDLGEPTSKFSRNSENKNLSILKNNDYKSILTEFELNDVLLLPKPAYKSLEIPEYIALPFPMGRKNILSQGLYKIKHSDTEQDFDLANWSWIDQGKAEFKAQTPAKKIAVTYSLSDCVGIAITHPKNGIAITHMDVLAYDGGLLKRLLGRFPDAIRKDCQVTLVSSFYTELLSNVYKTFISSGFDKSNFFADIEPIFFDFSGKIGPKENRYMSELNWNKPLGDIRQNSQKDIQSTLNEKLVIPKAVFINLTTHQMYSFNKKGDPDYKDSHILQKIQEDSGLYYDPKGGPLTLESRRHTYSNIHSGLSDY